MKELRVALATSHTINQQRTPYPGQVRKWPDRIEKSRSTHTSPAHDSRRRAWSGTSQIQPSYTNFYGMSRQNTRRRVSTHQGTQRPLSWHPTSGQMPTYTSSPVNIDIHQTLQSHYPELSPQILSTTHPMYELPDLYVQAGPLSNCSTSTAGLPNTSPVWQVASNQTYMLGNHQQPCQLQPDMNLWQDPMRTQGFQEPSKPMVAQYPNILANIHVPDAMAMIENENEEEEDGEILVGVGLYDDPPETSRHAPTLKLAETWNPPPSSDPDSDEAELEDVTDDINVDPTQIQDQPPQKSEPQNFQPMANIEQPTISRGDEEASTKELWQGRTDQSPINGLGFGTGWMHAPSWQNYVDRRATLLQ